MKIQNSVAAFIDFLPSKTGENVFYVYFAEHRLTYDSIADFTLVKDLEKVGFETKILLISWQQL